MYTIINIYLAFSHVIFYIQYAEYMSNNAREVRQMNPTNVLLLFPLMGRHFGVFRNK